MARLYAARGRIFERSTEKRAPAVEAKS